MCNFLSSITGTTSKIDSICLMYDTSKGSVLTVRPSISKVAGKSLIVIDAALKHASAKFYKTDKSYSMHFCFESMLTIMYLVQGIRLTMKFAQS